MFMQNINSLQRYIQNTMGILKKYIERTMLNAILKTFLVGYDFMSHNLRVSISFEECKCRGFFVIRINLRDKHTKI